MTHDELCEKCRKAMGNKIPFDMRDRWALFLREQRTEIFMRYEWIRDPRIYSWVSNSNDLELHDGVEWFGIIIVDDNGQPLNVYTR